MFTGMFEKWNTAQQHKERTSNTRNNTTTLASMWWAEGTTDLVSHTVRARRRAVQEQVMRKQKHPRIWEVTVVVTMGWGWKWEKEMKRHKNWKKERCQLLSGVNCALRKLTCCIPYTQYLECARIWGQPLVKKYSG